MKHPDNFLNGLSNNELAVFLAIFGLICSVIGFFIKRLFERRDSEKAEFSESKKEFIGMLQTIIVAAESDRMPGGFIKSNIGKHRAAFRIFKIQVERFRSPETASRLEEIWQKYNRNGHISYGLLDSRSTIKTIQGIINFVNDI